VILKHIITSIQFSVAIAGIYLKDSYVVGFDDFVVLTEDAAVSYLELLTSTGISSLTQLTL
jgi:hypothetical protein